MSLRAPPQRTGLPRVRPGCEPRGRAREGDEPGQADEDVEAGGPVREEAPPGAAQPQEDQRLRAEDPRQGAQGAAGREAPGHPDDGRTRPRQDAGPHENAQEDGDAQRVPREDARRDHGRALQQEIWPAEKGMCALRLRAHQRRVYQHRRGQRARSQGAGDREGEVQAPGAALEVQTGPGQRLRAARDRHREPGGGRELPEEARRAWRAAADAQTLHRDGDAEAHAR